MFFIMSAFFFVFNLMVLYTMTSLTHPISFSALLIMYSIMISIISGSMSTTWFMYLLILVFLGGVMVLIIYMSTLAANEKFSKLQVKNIILPLTAVLPMCMLDSMFNTSSKFKLFKIGLIQLYEPMNFTCTFMLMMYLIISMVCIVKLVKFEEGPLISRL